jgi:hypothetical protein
VTTPATGAARAFARRGWLQLPGFLDAGEMRLLAEQHAQLHARAAGLLAQLQAGSVDIAQFYRQRPGELIVVPERDQPLAVCRFERIAQGLPAFGDAFAEKIRARLGALFGEPFVLFKDKCNVKSPGGGAFPAHQDIAAYDSFGPPYHVTAAVALDAATLENGCLEVAEDYLDLDAPERETRDTDYGALPVFGFHRGGPRNGDILDAVQSRMRWQPVEMAAGDVLLFDSYLPHRSAPNRSAQPRRMYFLTFNPARYGDRYDAYYRRKSEDYGNPMFHVSTPTRHAALAQEQPS